ncbi:MAG: class I SAM-dependent methyltransferase [Acidiferrobacteraceae bacterium]
MPVADFIKRILPRPVYDRLRWERQLLGCSGFNGTSLENAYHTILGEIDTAALDQLRERVRSDYERDPKGAAKYPDHAFWLRTAIVQAVRVDLHRNRGLRVLDLGCGPGYFLAVCRHFGHEALGIDIPDELFSDVERRVYREMFLAHHCRKLPLLIRPYVPLEVDGTFDLISAFLVCFNNHKRANEWSRAEWEFFLGDALSHLRPGGRLYFGLNGNPERYGSLIWYDPATRELFAERGRLKGNTVVIEHPA